MPHFLYPGHCTFINSSQVCATVPSYLVTSIKRAFNWPSRPHHTTHTFTPAFRLDSWSFEPKPITLHLSPLNLVSLIYLLILPTFGECVEFIFYHPVYSFFLLDWRFVNPCKTRKLMRLAHLPVLSSKCLKYVLIQFSNHMNSMK